MAQKPVIGGLVSVPSVPSGVLTNTEIRLWDFFAWLSSNPATPIRVGLVGDSLIDNASAILLNTFQRIYGVCGVSLGELTGSTSLGATTVNDAFTYWITGDYFNVPAAGEVIFSQFGTTAVEATELRVYYVTEPGAGTFKVQTSVNGGAYADEVGYTNVSADAVLAGHVISIAKTTWRGRWRIKIVGLTGTVKIIGAAMYQATRPGVIWFRLSKGGIELADMNLVPPAILNPILADVAPNLLLISHLDGVEGVTNEQANLQDLITTATASAPSWISISTSVGDTVAQDILNKNQNQAQKNLAKERGDAYFDNRTWMGFVAEAIENGLIVEGDPHITAKAIRAFAYLLFNQFGLGAGPARNNGRTSLLAFAGATATISTNPQSGNDPNLEFTGGWLGAYHPDIPGPALLLEDSAGPTANIDRGVIDFNGNKFRFINQAGASVTLEVTSGIGNGLILRDSGAGATSGKGILGGETQRFYSAHANYADFDQLRLKPPSTVALIADNTTVSTSMRSYIRLSSDNVTAGDRTFILSQSTTSGHVLILEWTGTNAAELLDGSAQGTAGTHRLSADWIPTEHDTLTLMSNGTDWIEVARSTN